MFPGGIQKQHQAVMCEKFDPGFAWMDLAQQTNTCLKLTIKTVGKGAKYVQS